MKKVLVFSALCRLCRVVCKHPLRARVTRARNSVNRKVRHIRHFPCFSSTFFEEAL